MTRYSFIFLASCFMYKVSAECGVPSNIDTLPDFARDEIVQIWKNYQPGSPCDRELQIQEDILDVINGLETEGASNNSGSSKSLKNSRSDDSKPSSKLDYDYDQIAANGGTPIPLLSSEQSRGDINRDDVDDLDQITFDDVAMMQFDNVNAPFLQSASPSVRHQFEKVWNDQDIPSEGLRSLKIQTLAVSLLTSQQLSEYNRWATKRRRVLKAREQEMRNLSFDAKQTLRKMSSMRARDPEEQVVVPAQIKQELTSFVQKLNRRRNLRLLV